VVLRQRLATPKTPERRFIVTRGMTALVTLVVVVATSSGPVPLETFVGTPRPKALPAR